MNFVSKGWKSVIQPVTEELKERLNYELSTIKNMGYVDYFLIVWDFIRYAQRSWHYGRTGTWLCGRKHRCLYVLGSHSIDPIRYDLLFERFLNPERVSMPDIDVDFCYRKTTGSD